MLNKQNCESESEVKETVEVKVSNEQIFQEVRIQLGILIISVISA
jgi:hypothetical protein